MHLRAIDNKHLNPGQPGLRAQRQDLTKQAGQRRLVTLTKARDRAVIRPPIRSDHPERHVLDARAPRPVLSGLLIGVALQHVT
jgi:hypothetical protein